jgi:hypothetical protein
MKPAMASSLAIVIASVVACSPRVRVMQPIVFGSAPEKPTDKPAPENPINELTFPEVFCKDSLKASAVCTAARNCAQLYNGSVGENLFCSKRSDLMTAGESASILIFGIATGIASTVETEKARQHYTAVGLSAAAVTSALLAYDNFLNCRERAVQEFNNAEARLKHLETAALLLQCAKRAEEQERVDAGSPGLPRNGGTGGGKPKGNDSVSGEDDEADPACGRLNCGTFRAKCSSELRDQANTELLRCIAIGRPTGFGPIPSRPSIH